MTSTLLDKPTATGATHWPALGPLAWRDVGVAALLAIAAVAVSADAWADILRLGLADEELSYVLLAPCVIGWLVWVRRAELLRCHRERGWVGLPILLAGWLVYQYGFRADPVLWRAGAVIIVVGTIVMAIGGDVLVKLAPAFFACIFLIPILPNGRYRLAAPLQLVAAEATQFVGEVIGMSIERSGSLLSTNGVEVTVAEACNGMRMVLTLFMVCYTVAFTIPMRRPVRILFLLASPLVAILFNVARLVPTLWMFGHRSRAEAETFHTVSGWVMSILAFVLLMGLCKAMERTATSVKRARANAALEVSS